MAFQFVDKATISGTRKRDDGYLVADARVARTGIQLYAGYEVGRPDLAVVRVYRPEDEVFSRDTLASFAHRPVTNDHPPEQVTDKNWRQYAVGHTDGEIARDGSFIRVPLMVADGSSIQDVERGKRELSSGYTCDLDWTPGKTPDGELFDAVQRNIRANHVAIVQRGRAGSEVRIGDDAGKWGVSPITVDMKEAKPMTLKTVTIDGIPVEVTDQGAIAIETLKTRLADADAKLTSINDAHQAALNAKDAELAKKDAEIETLKGQIVDAVTLDQLVAKRAKLVADAQRIAADVKTEGLSDADIKRAVVAAKYGEDRVVDKSPAYIDALFDVLSEQAADAGNKKPVADQFKDAMSSRKAPVAPGGDNGYSNYVQRLRDGYKNVQA